MEEYQVYTDSVQRSKQNTTSPIRIAVRIGSVEAVIIVSIVQVMSVKIEMMRWSRPERSTEDSIWCVHVGSVEPLVRVVWEVAVQSGDERIP